VPAACITACPARACRQLRWLSGSDSCGGAGAGKTSDAGTFCQSIRGALTKPRHLHQQARYIEQPVATVRSREIRTTSPPKDLAWMACTVMYPPRLARPPPGGCAMRRSKKQLQCSAQQTSGATNWAGTRSGTQQLAATLHAKNACSVEGQTRCVCTGVTATAIGTLCLQHVAQREQPSFSTVGVNGVT
jgi:hypothetical protein